MKIVIVCEGRTEGALKNTFRDFVSTKVRHTRVGIETRSMAGHLERNKFKTIVHNLLENPDVIAVVALTDVYPRYDDAADAKEVLISLVGDVSGSKQFLVHVAQFEIEAWLIPFWDEICKSLSVKAKRPGAKPEEVNGSRPPSHRLKELYRRASKRYDKVLDAAKWLTSKRLDEASEKCPELKPFLDSLVELASTAAA